MGGGGGGVRGVSRGHLVGGGGECLKGAPQGGTSWGGGGGLKVAPHGSHHALILSSIVEGLDVFFLYHRLQQFSQSCCVVDV